MGSLPSPHYRGKELDLGLLRKFHDLIHHLVYRLLLNLFPALRTVRNSDPCVEQPEIVIDLRHRPYRRTGIPVGGLLVNRDGRRKSLYALHVRLLHLSQELSGIGGQGLHVPSLPLRIDRIEGQGGLA